MRDDSKRHPTSRWPVLLQCLSCPSLPFRNASSLTLCPATHPGVWQTVLCQKAFRHHIDCLSSHGLTQLPIRVMLMWVQATIVVYDSYHKRCKVQYDDGEEEWLALPKQRFRWLLPRAQSAGCNQAIQASLAAVGAEGIQPFWHRNPCLEGASPNDQVCCAPCLPQLSA